MPRKEHIDDDINNDAERLRLEGTKDVKATPGEVDRALLDAIIRRGCQCLSQASLRTGFGIVALAEAKNRLIERQLIRTVAGSENRDAVQVSYEVSV